jgi:hypothetical protein
MTARQMTALDDRMPDEGVLDDSLLMTACYRCIPQSA